MQVDRRWVLAGMSAASLAGGAGWAMARTQIDLGDMRITSVSDGHLVLPGAFFFDGLPREETAAILGQHGLSTKELTPPCNVTVLQHEERTVLFDAGSGTGFMPTAGRLFDSLEVLDIKTEDVTHVVFTHCHPDHLWGVLDDFDDPVFASAQHMIGRKEWEYWTNPATVTTIGEARASFAVGAARRLAVIQDIMSFFAGGQEILPGVASHASFGHTPGHMSFEIRSQNEAILVGGDAIGNHHVAFERPDWPSGADQDRVQGAATRMRLLDKLAQEQMTLIGFHLPGGGIGRVERKDNAYRFVTEEM